MGLLKDSLERLRNTFPVPPFALLNRRLRPGMHAYLDVFPGARESPALTRVCRDPDRRDQLVTTSKVCISLLPGFAYINTRVPCIMLSYVYYVTGTHADLYLDLLHELTHLRQLSEGADLWDGRFRYVDRPTEIEGYAVAVEEARRLGFSEPMIRRHLHNPWMTRGDVERLQTHIAQFLAS